MGFLKNMISDCSLQRVRERRIRLPGKVVELRSCIKFGTNHGQHNRREQEKRITPFVLETVSPPQIAQKNENSWLISGEENDRRKKKWFRKLVTFNQLTCKIRGDCFSPYTSILEKHFAMIFRSAIARLRATCRQTWLWRPWRVVGLTAGCRLTKILSDSLKWNKHRPTWYR